MNAVPRLSIGLPVYNGEKYLAESLDALLGQTYGDFELIISDNASTDRTQEICREYAGPGPADQLLPAAGQHRCDTEPQLDLRALPRRAVQVGVVRRPVRPRPVAALRRGARRATRTLVLAHAHQAIIDANGDVVLKVDYPLDTDNPLATERFRSLLFTVGGDDFYGVIRSDILRRTPLNGSYHHADRTIVAELALYGRFHQVPELLFFRRDHPDRAERANPTIRSRSREPGPAPGQPAAAPDRPPAGRVRRRLRRRRSAGRRCRRRTGAAATRHLARWMAEPCAARSVVAPDRGQCGAQRTDRDPGQFRGCRSAEGLLGMSTAGTSRPPRVGVFGLLGSGNLGNDGSLDAVLAIPPGQAPGGRDQLCLLRP